MDAVDIDSQDLDVATPFRKKSDDRPHQHSLAAAGGADQTENFTPSNVEGEMVDDDLTAKSHHEIPNPNSKLV
jgi:hypothetical protein